MSGVARLGIGAALLRLDGVAVRLSASHGWEMSFSEWDGSNELDTREGAPRTYVEDTIAAPSKVVTLRESQSRPTQGVVTFKHNGVNQRDEIARTCRRLALIHRKPV